MRNNGPVALAFHTLVILFVLAPLAIVVLVAFTPDETLTLPTHGLSLRWFRAILDYPDFITAFANSVKLAFASATLSLALGLPAGLAIGRATFPGRAFVNGLLLSPLVIPGLVLGIALLRLFALIGATGSFAWLVLAHTIVITPFVMRLVLASVAGLDRSIEQAACSLGADPWTIFRRITLPLIVPGITGGWLLAFINSFDELTMSIFVTSPQTVTLPVRMYMYATESIDPMMASVSALVIFITAGAMLLLDRVYGLNRILIGQH
ncbi:ABC transporter permease [Burkholderia vietnamiensis]|uniref:ABC transporter permease n=2 Tax=Burkholderiaceae TaxID=119060 RepID=A0AAW7SW53_BURVI|nr:ABC transporter permease [Burkholderia vietnamiensis]AOJ15196.1 ABC transporter permease [Burkholderia vietnamiensis]KKI37737.1 ABC transporter permease [Burkholderia vietnamiensis]KVE21660.1 ABC transporter permease [Burkholderia vietnamiensis]KVE51900.1 ABC transporter permease [Burkholderia vietnamiensis]KVE63630.1 ABC transporter permease [Burkholderia vietnamiensis]